MVRRPFRLTRGGGAEFAVEYNAGGGGGRDVLFHPGVVHVAGKITGCIAQRGRTKGAGHSQNQSQEGRQYMPIEGRQYITPTPADGKEPRDRRQGFASPRDGDVAHVATVGGARAFA
eukprot:7898990-Pyramimonas_sp.AAC.2